MAAFLWEPIYIIMLAAADILFTYVLLNKVIKMGKGKNYESEANPIVKFFLKKYGLHKGTRVAAFYSVAAITGVIYYLSVRYGELAFRNMLYFVMGVYSMMLLIHISSFKFLYRQQEVIDDAKKKNGRKAKK